ncbi:nitrogen regulation protein NR(II) [Endozoicomonas sp. SM1973]|uniref:Sensory histidine kinase/phosphatase NtrB n=1 Tax=Spartinivicinus marinus TaxID=2994442 RepID=A0A853I9Z7_9GAMM|nr:nitrogen regulation protein NR(II) [Spartinivicinus marinus]MCX4026512.1 nitrogen regulation protein NR(II) [Spartinivicinus marinus]NYZ66884.1 nitrogen regulation protein NR(II) [Spartinivicinus marinus]
MSDQLLEFLTTAVLEIDQQLSLLYINPAAEMLFAVSGSQVTGAALEALFVEQPSNKPVFLNALSSGQPFTKREATLHLPNGQLLTVDYAVTPVTNGRDSLVMEIQPRDRLLKITREEALREKQESSKLLVRSVAHEVKNPLGGIRGAAQLLAKELPDSALQDYTQVIIEETDRLTNLVDRMIGPTKPSKLGPCSIHEVLERVAQLILAETHNQLTIIKDYDPSIPDVMADIEQLIQAILNIVRNALQAIQTVMPLNEGMITFKTRVLRQFTIGNHRHRLVCQVNIMDNGPGVPANILEHIFYPLVSGRAEGSGLGLSIAQSILQQHQGMISCESEPGKTCFSMYLPIQSLVPSQPITPDKSTTRSSIKRRAHDCT